MAFRRIAARPAQRALLRAHGMVLRRRADITAQICTRPDGRPCDATRVQQLRVDRHRVRWPARAARRPAHVVLVGCAHRPVLGRPRADRPGAPHHLVDQLDLPRDGQPPVQVPRPLGQRLVAGHSLIRRELAQPAPRRSHLCSARRREGPDRHQRPADRLDGEGGLGVGRPLAHAPG